MRSLATTVLAVAACGQSAAPPATTVDLVATPLLVHHDTSPPLRDIAPVRATRVAEERDVERRPPFVRVATPDFVDPAAQTAFAPGAAPPPPLASFEGQGAGFVGPAGAFTVDGDPPDTDGAVGPNHYLQMVNVSFTVFAKTGTPMFGPAAFSTVFAGFGGGCETNNDGDPIVRYDAGADRWLISQFMLSATPNLECVAVSATGDPLGAWHRYAFSYTVSIDYPKIGVWSDAYYVTQNTNAGNTICALERAAMLAGTAARSQCFTQAVQGLMPADVSGKTMPAAGTPEYVLALATDALSLWTLHVDWTTPASSKMTGPTSLPVAAFAQPTHIKQPGSTTTLDAIGEQLMFGVEWRAFADHAALVVNHTVSSGGRIGVRWYEVRDPGGTPTVFQQGTYVPDASQRWMGSINIDRAGDIAIGYSVAGNIKPTIRYAGRTATDPPGMLGAEATLQDGGGVKVDTSSPSRWGDYSTMTVDPADDCTFWYTQEYLAGSGAAWHTRIGAFKFDACVADGGGSGSGSGAGSGAGAGAGSDGPGHAHHAGCAAGADGSALLAALLAIAARRRKRAS